AIIHEKYPSLEFFESKEFLKMINVIHTPRFKEQLESSKYSFDNNPPGFELGFALQKFNGGIGAELFLKKDILKSYDFDRQAWGVNNKFDPKTAAARVYEVYQLENTDIAIDSE